MVHWLRVEIQEKEYQMKIRSFLYWLARLLGDVNAVRKGRVRQRIVRRVAGKATGRAMRKTLR